jgi:methylthioribose-1-phosphate isomerase
LKVAGEAYRSIWLDDDGWAVRVIDQTRLPFDFTTLRLESVEDAAEAIARMYVRGAPLIGVTAAYGLCLALRRDPSDASLHSACERLLATRPTGRNLAWALDEMRASLGGTPPDERLTVAYARAAELADRDVATCRAIGEHGLPLLEQAWERGGRNAPVQVLTHCNAGWLATVDWGTALAPIYLAHDRGIPVHVWVDETRPRNQGASLTAWELGEHGVPHTVIADNVGGHLMQHRRVDLCLVGTDRTTANGDVCNKIGTYLKALAAHDNQVPFYVALPTSTVDWELTDGVADVPIEERAGDELRRIQGRGADGSLLDVEILPEKSAVANYGFDVTPARLVTELVTERGRCPASSEGLAGLRARADS